MDNRIDAIYGRQSIDKKDSISIESQFEFCRYELKGGEAKEYKDKGYSGKNIERPDFQRLLQDIRLGLIKRVIVYKLDRISRSIVDFAKLMELFKQYDVEFVSCTEKFDTSTPMGRAMLNICIVFAQLERESIQMRVQDAFYSRCTKGYYMRGRTPYGFDTEPIVMDGIKTKKLVENAEMDFAELMFQMYAEPGNSYGDITRYFVKHSIKVYDKALQRGFISKLLRNPVYVQADMDIYEYYKAQGVKIESPPEMFTGDNSCYLYQGREGEEPILVIAPHQGRIPSQARIQLGDQMVGEGVVRDHRPLLIRLRVVLVKNALLHAKELINTVPVKKPAVARMHEQGRIARLLIVPRQCVDRLMHHAKGGYIGRRDHVCLNTGQNIKLRICRSRAEIAYGNMTAPGTR